MAYIIEIIGIIAGLFYMYMGVTKYGIWEGITIKGGFMPFVCGAIVTILCILMLVGKIKKGVKAEPFEKKALLPVAAMILILIVNLLVGLLPACIVVSLLWLRFIEKYSWKTSILTSVVLFAFMYGIFSLWLNVPFPEGLLGELL